MITFCSFQATILNYLSFDQSTLSTVHPVVGPPPLVTIDMVFESVKKMKAGRAAGPTGAVSEMLIADG